MSTEKTDFGTLSTRVKAEDLIVYKEFCKAFDVQHEAFSVLISRINPQQPTPETIEVIKEVERPLTENQFITELTPELTSKLTALRRYLKMEGKIPKESTKEEFTGKFLEQAIKYYIKYNYEFLNR